MNPFQSGCFLLVDNAASMKRYNTLCMLQSDLSIVTDQFSNGSEPNNGRLYVHLLVCIIIKEDPILLYNIVSLNFRRGICFRIWLLCCGTHSGQLPLCSRYVIIVCFFYIYEFSMSMRETTKNKALNLLAYLLKKTV